MTTTELATLQHAIEHLRQGIAEAHASFGDAPPVLRLANDLQRLEIDAQDLATNPPPHAPAPGGPPAPVVVPDTPLDESLWKDDADDEGVGGYHGRRP